MTCSPRSARIIIAALVVVIASALCFGCIASCGGASRKATTTWTTPLIGAEKVGNYMFARTALIFCDAKPATVDFTNGTLHVTYPDGTKAAGLGRGAVVSSRGLLLTAAHNRNIVAVYLYANSEYRSVPYVEHAPTKSGGSTPDDWKFLSLQGDSFPCFPVAQEQTLNEQVLHFGIGFSTGQATRLDTEQATTVIHTDLALQRGDSGGPVINTRGELIGIASRISGSPGQNDGICVLPSPTEFWHAAIAGSIVAPSDARVSP